MHNEYVLQTSSPDRFISSGPTPEICLSCREKSGKRRIYLFRGRKCPPYDDSSFSSSGGLVGLSLASDVCKVDIVRPTLPDDSVEAEAFETVHILFTGYDNGRMVVCETMSFTSESQLTATLNLENWPQCDRIQVFLLEGAYTPFCPELSIPTANSSVAS